MTNSNITQTDALVAHFRSASRKAQRDFVRWIMSSEEGSTENIVRDTEKVFGAICRGLKDADSVPSMSIDEAEALLKSL